MNSRCFQKRSARRMFRSFLAALLLAPLALLAQNPRGTVRGVVLVPSGPRVPGARILIHAAESSLHREASSDDRGEFRIEDLLPGTYHLTVTAPGFAEARADVKVTVSSVREITVKLK